MNRIILWVIFGILSVYVVVILYLYFNQHNIVLSPSPHYHPPPKSFNITQNFIQFGDNDSLHTWYIKNNKRKLTALYFSGNSFNISYRLFHADVFNQLDLNAIMFDYKGYGLSTGLINGTESFYESSDIVYTYLTDSLEIPLDSIIFWGYSMGAPIAVELASGENILGLILESPVISINKITSENYPYLPFSLINKFDFDIEDYIDKTSAPILIIHSEDDNVIPFRHVSTFYNNLVKENKELIKIKGEHRQSSFNSFSIYYNGVSSFIYDLTKKVK